MITVKHYTEKNEHPDDKIYDVKKFINELSNVQDFYFNQLMLELNLKDTPEAHDYLFDYVFNEEKEILFTEYLDRLDVNYNDIHNG
jgi:hypothetical protein